MALISPPPYNKPYSVSPPPRLSTPRPGPTAVRPRTYAYGELGHSVTKANSCSGNARRGHHGKRALPVASATPIAVAEKGPESSFGRVTLSDAVVKRRRNVYWSRKWNSRDVATAGVVVVMHLLCFFAPFTFKWGAFGIAVGLYVVSGFWELLFPLIGIFLTGASSFPNGSSTCLHIAGFKRFRGVQLIGLAHIDTTTSSVIPKETTKPG